MHNLNITESIQKRIKKGMSFVLVGSMLATSAVVIKKGTQNIDNGRHHQLQQEISTVQQIEVTQGINLYLNDHVFIPRDVNGNEVMPFIYQGTTYLPIRAITSALGAEVGYANNTAMITRGATAQINPGVEWRKDIQPTTTVLNANTSININVDGVPFIPKDVNGNLVNSFVIEGTTYVPIRALCNEFNIPVIWDGRNNRIYLGSHIALVDPDSHSLEEDRIKQNYCNISLVGLQQCQMDVETLRLQFGKYQAFIDEILATYRIVEGSYHAEVEALHTKVVDNYSTILGAVQKYTDEYLQLEWNDISNKMQFKDQLSAEGYAFFPKAYGDLNEKIAKLNACCTDEEIDKLYAQLYDIIERYQRSIHTDKVFTK